MNPNGNGIAPIQAAQPAQAVPAAQPPQAPARLSCAQAPAMLGQDPRVSRWSLWQSMARNGGAPLESRTRRLGERLHAQVVDSLLESGALGASARRPKRTVAHATLPLETTPDFVVPDSPAHGQGPGVGFVAVLDAAEWRRDWIGHGPEPKAPPWMQARLQASMLASGARWALAVPQVGWSSPRPPITVQADPDMADRLGTEAFGFMRTVAERQPPAPDGRADSGALAALAELSPAPSGAEPPRLEGKRAEWFEGRIQSIAEAETRIDSLRAQIEEIKGPLQDTRNELIEAIGPDGSVRIGDRIVGLRIDGPRQPDPKAKRARLVISSARDEAPAAAAA